MINIRDFVGILMADAVLSVAGAFAKQPLRFTSVIVLVLLTGLSTGCADRLPNRVVVRNSAGTGKPLSDGRPQHIRIRCDEKLVRDLVIPATQADVVQQIDLSSLVAEGKHRLTITDLSDTAAIYQMSLRYHLPETEEPATQEALSIELAYDKTDLSVNDTGQDYRSSGPSLRVLRS